MQAAVAWTIPALELQLVHVLPRKAHLWIPVEMQHFEDQPELEMCFLVVPDWGRRLA